jgi:hypothetical protein
MPFLTRYRRRVAAGFAVAALAFAHVAIAAHGCLQDRTYESHPGCDEHPAAVSAELLCSVHYQTETQTLDLAKLPLLSPFDTPVLVIASEFATVVPLAPGFHRAVRVARASAAPPPLGILYSRFLL